MSSGVLASACERLAALVADGVVTTGRLRWPVRLLALAWPLGVLTAFGEVAGSALSPLAHVVAALAPGLVG